MRLILAVAGKDVRAELRSRTALLSALVFAALVLVVFNFARDPTALSATALAPSVLWVTFALAALLAMNRAFTIERENGALDGLLLAPVSREALFLGKLLANLAFVGSVELVTLPLFTLFFNVSLWPRLPGILGDDGARHHRIRGGRNDLQRHGGTYPPCRAPVARSAAPFHGAAAYRCGAGHIAAARGPTLERDAGVDSASRCCMTSFL